MKLIIGLGNPGEQYLETRHNLGFSVVDNFLKDNTALRDSKWEINEKLKSHTFMYEWQPKNGKSVKILLAKPQTYMNNSGMAVKLLLDFYKINPSDLWVVHDDLDLPLGKLKIRFAGAGAGHHGVENIIEILKNDKFYRFRMGIGNVRHVKGRIDGESVEKKVSRRHLGDTSSYVLGVFEGKERTEIKKLVKDTVRSIETALEHGLESAMNRFNTK